MVIPLLPQTMMASGIDSGAGHGGLMRQVHTQAAFAGHWLHPAVA